MPLLPPIPKWDASHPIIVHAPLGVLPIVPVVIVLAILWKRQRPGLSLAALALMGIGTLGAVLAVASGDAAEDIAETSGLADTVLHRHEDLAELSRTAFIGLTAMLGVMLGAGWIWRAKIKNALAVTGLLVFLALHLAGLVLLANAAHEGGRLVHEFGVRAPLAASPGAPTGQADDQRGRDRD